MAEVVKSPYVLGVFPYLPPVRLEKLYGPVAADFSAALGRPIHFRTKSDFETFAQELAAQRYDIALLQPFDYVEAFDRYGYLPLARRPEPLAAVLMIKMDSPLEKLSDLKGKTVALPPKRAAVSRLLTAHLQAAGETTVTWRHYKNHTSCLQAVITGGADACGSALLPVRSFETSQGVLLRKLVETPAIAPVLFAVHSRVPRKEQEALLQRILSWGSHASGRQLLSVIGTGQAFVRTQDHDYESVRRYAAVPVQK
ncbi:MAG: phosphate/phosphite/phosphonate ABC transporter substrate-binding protein [Gammaproteobacteria bacterium]